MTNVSKAKGTAGETAVARYFQTNGFPDVERRALHGGTDLGDLVNVPGSVVEVKAGHAAWNASDNLINQWLGEALRERDNAGAAVAFLVVARRQKNVADWWAVLTMGDVQKLMGYPEIREPARHIAVRYRLCDAVLLLKEWVGAQTP